MGFRRILRKSSSSISDYLEVVCMEVGLVFGVAGGKFDENDM